MCRSRRCSSCNSKRWMSCWRITAVAGLSSSVGASGFNASVNRGRLFISLQAARPARRQCDAPAARDRRARCATSSNALPGLRVFLGAGAGPARRRTRKRFAIPKITLWSPDIEELQKLVPQVQDRVKRVASVTDVTTDRPSNGRPADQCHHRPFGGGHLPHRRGDSGLSTTRLTTRRFQQQRFRPSTPSATSIAPSASRRQICLRPDGVYLTSRLMSLATG